MKIIIVGAGISGLTLAYACHCAGMEVSLYDKTRELKNIGGGILLWPHGLRYLEWMGLSNCLLSFRIPIHECSIIGTKGQAILRESYAAINSLIGGEILPVDRSLMQQAL